ncbi:alpha/beta hydrolase [Marinobacter sediminum]|uniref:hypothetical protein n=1 Tax=Marinobacter sediminum TaxID=256323 RepID=UPI00202FDCC0|nr:hypothetical protein [Marinobacter sediminum]MCM0612312.1 alpha/beta hydrolase [Marinobacter sediminum]
MPTPVLYDELRRNHPDLDRHQLRERYRLGSVVFAAADVELDRFLERLPSASDLAQEMIVTVTDDDVALNAARMYMRTDLGPEMRGLRNTEIENLWYFPTDYPGRVRESARSVLAEDWATPPDDQGANVAISRGQVNAAISGLLPRHC